MATIKKFEDITAWQKARELSKEIYSISQKQSFSVNFSLKNQMLSSSGSIMDQEEYFKLPSKFINPNEIPNKKL